MPKRNFAAGEVLTAANVNTYLTTSKNVLLNSDFSINQRNFTSATSGGYFFDQWIVGGSSFTHSVQTFSPGIVTTLGVEAKNYARTVTAGQTGEFVFTQLRNLIEDVRTFAGQTVTVSFWAKAASGSPYISFEWQQVFGTGGSPSSDVFTYASKIQLTGGTNWTRYSMTVTVPSISGKTVGTTTSGHLGLAFWLSAGTGFNARAGSIGIQNNTIDMWGVQLEEGSTATPFSRANATLQGELAACQRYYWRAGGSNNYEAFGNGQTYSTSEAFVVVRFPVTMRVAPTSIDYSNLAIGQPGISANAITTLTLNNPGKNGSTLYAVGSSFPSINNPVVIEANNSTNGYLGFSAEL